MSSSEVSTDLSQRPYHRVCSFLQLVHHSGACRSPLPPLNSSLLLVPGVRLLSIRESFGVMGSSSKSNSVGMCGLRQGEQKMRVREALPNTYWYTPAC